MMPGGDSAIPFPPRHKGRQRSQMDGSARDRGRGAKAGGQARIMQPDRPTGRSAGHVLQQTSLAGVFMLDLELLKVS